MGKRIFVSSQISAGVTTTVQCGQGPRCLGTWCGREWRDRKSRAMSEGSERGEGWQRCQKFRRSCEESEEPEREGERERENECGRGLSRGASAFLPMLT